jgi:2,5-diamino-6-(ribosylamino)-4(3H)-pyrimidinone 5'-phosphate reductase
MLRPWVSTNLAISADGKITSAGHHPATWTSAADHARLLELRQGADALLIGRGTLETDRMTLTVPGKSVQPLRCIVSGTGRLSPDHPVFRTPGGEIHLLATESPQHPPDLPAILHHQSLGAFLETLASIHSVKRMHCEGGGMLIRSLAEMDAIDEFHLTLASHTVFGGRQAPTTTGIPADFLPESRDFEITRFEPHPDEGECFLTYRRSRSQ